MKNPLIALAVALSLVAAPALAQSFDMGTLTPTLDFPEPAPDTPSKNVSGIDK